MSFFLPQGTYNALIQRSIDLRQLYRQAASTAEPGLRFVLNENAQTLDVMISDMQSQLRASGGVPRKNGTLWASTRRYFGSMTKAIAPWDPVWIRELADKETALLHAFEKLVKKLPPELALTLRRQLPRLNSIHRDMDNLAGNDVR